MYPTCKWFESYKTGKVLAITGCLLIVTVLIISLLALLIWQVKTFSADAEAIFKKLELALIQLQLWLNQNFGIEQQNGLSSKLTGSIAGILQSTIQTTVLTLFFFFLTPIFTALFLYHRRIFVQYLKLITPAKYQHQLDSILLQTISTYFSYIKGMLMVYIIVGILNSLGLFLLGVEHALLFGMLCAIMTIIPYVGIIVSALLPISVVWLETGNIWYPLGVVAVFTFVQYLEANVIFPKVVGKQLHVSTLAMLIAIIAGGIIWGVAGMILFIPFVAIMKIISEHIEEWKPLNLLLSRK